MNTHLANAAEKRISYLPVLYIRLIFSTLTPVKYSRFAEVLSFAAVQRPDSPASREIDNCFLNLHGRPGKILGPGTPRKNKFLSAKIMDLRTS